MPAGGAVTRQCRFGPPGGHQAQGVDMWPDRAGAVRRIGRGSFRIPGLRLARCGCLAGPGLLGADRREEGDGHCRVLLRCCIRLVNLST